MRLVFALATAAFAVAASAAHAAEDQLKCSGSAAAASQPPAEVSDLRLKVEGGLGAPGALTYAWSRQDLSVPLELKALSGETLSFHGLAPRPDGAVVVADAELNRSTLALVLKIRRVGAEGKEEVTLETTCRPL